MEKRWTKQMLTGTKGDDKLACVVCKKRCHREGTSSDTTGGRRPRRRVYDEHHDIVAMRSLRAKEIGAHKEIVAQKDHRSDKMAGLSIGSTLSPYAFYRLTRLKLRTHQTRI